MPQENCSVYAQNVGHGENCQKIILQDTSMNLFVIKLTQIACQVNFDTKNILCLGYASCGTGTLSVGVVRDDAGVQNTVNIAAATYCDCQIRAGTVLSALATGATGTTPVAGIPAFTPTV